MIAASKIVADNELAHETTRKLAGSLEPAAFLFQALNLLVTMTLDDLTPFGREIVGVLAVIHFAAAAVAWRTGGPFSRGGPWIILWAGAVLAMPLVMAHLVVTPFTYASSPQCVQLCTYPTAPIALFSFYPWIGRDQIQLRPAAEIAILTIIVAEPLFIVELLHGDQITSTNYISIAVSGIWNIAAFTGGKAIGRLCRIAVAQLSSTRTAAFDFIIDFLHTDIQGAIAGMQRTGGGRASVLNTLHDLYDRCTVYMHALRSARYTDDLVEVVPLLADASQPYYGALDPLHIGRADWLIAKRSMGIFIQFALGSFLKNCVQHGARSAAVDFSCGAGRVTLDVKDDGPGFSPRVLDDTSTSLNRLRSDARFFGGDLVYTENLMGGAWLRLELPID